MGSSLLTTGSILAAFFAGGVALFAPCCIVFLAPSYLAVAVKNRRWRLLPLTFVFAAGLALVLVPITLGMSLVSATISNYHEALYYAGGSLMLLLAVFALSGRMISLPSMLRAPDTARGDAGSFFALGVFSGIASSCCAPVLAGVMTLSALSGSVVGGTALGLAYVFGMTFPLFVMACSGIGSGSGNAAGCAPSPSTSASPGAPCTPTPSTSPSRSASRSWAASSYTSATPGG
jgi:cytochrome c biogenesis protein CcdA